MGCTGLKGVFLKSVLQYHTMNLCKCNANELSCGPLHNLFILVPMNSLASGVDEANDDETANASFVYPRQPNKKRESVTRGLLCSSGM